MLSGRYRLINGDFFCLFFQIKGENKQLLVDLDCKMILFDH